MSSINLCQCGSRKASLQRFSAAFYVKCPDCGLKTHVTRNADEAIAAFNELSPAGKPTQFLIRYSELNNWSKMRDEGTIAIHAMEFDNKRNGYWVTVSWKQSLTNRLN